jgi:hypothetical protein
LDLDVLSYGPIYTLYGFLDVHRISDDHIRVPDWLDFIWHFNLLILDQELSCPPSLVLRTASTAPTLLATASTPVRRLSAMIHLDLHPLHQPHIVLIFELFLEVLLDASIVDARNKVAIALNDISHQVLHLVLKQVSDLIRHSRVGAPNRLDGHPQLVSVEVDLRLTRIYSNVFEQHLVEVILVVFEVPEQVVPLFIVHILGTFIFIIASEVDVDAISLRLLILILQAAIFMQEKL